MPEKTSPKWLGGFFEAGSTVSFATSESTVKGVRYCYGYPLIQLTEKNFSYLEKLQSLLGGKPPKMRSDHSCCWRLKGQMASELILAAGPYSPSRREVYEAVQNWVFSDNDERYGIAREMIGHTEPLELPAGVYYDLVRDNEFVAGVVDQRGNPVMHVRYHKYGIRRTPSMNLSISNQGLYEALREAWGGSLSQVTAAGEERTFQGRKLIVQKTSYMWSLEKGATTRLFQAIRKNMHIRGETFDKLFDPIES